MYQKNHVGSLKETVVLRFTNGYQITLDAGVEMSMSLTMVEQSAQQSVNPDAYNVGEADKQFSKSQGLKAQ